jgi:RNA polymerase sigma-70 factor (ECF subfamily)
MSIPIKERLWLYRIRSRRDGEAYASIYDRYVVQIHRFILFKVSDDELAKELASDVFLKTWEYLIGGKEVESISGLLYAIARSSIADHYRKKKLELVSLDDAPDVMDKRLSGMAEINEDIRATFAAIGRLKDEYREALYMKHIDGLTNNEIAAALGKNGGAVRVLIHRATEALKEVMDR